MFEIVNLIKATNIKPYLRSFHFFCMLSTKTHDK